MYRSGLVDTLFTHANTNALWPNFLVWSPLWIYASSVKNKTNLQGNSKPYKGAVSLKSEIALSDIIVGDAKYLGLQIDSHYPLTSCNSAASTPKMDNETKQVRSIFLFT